jgi:metal-dependent amidase/aminoacylase/carboxypeptidase family protein
LLNDPAVVDICRQVVQKEISPACWQDVEKPTMGGEDFAYYLCDCPGALLRLGIGESRPGLHSSAFDFNDDALEHGILFLVLATLRFLE